MIPTAALALLLLTGSGAAMASPGDAPSGGLASPRLPAGDPKLIGSSSVINARLNDVSCTGPTTCMAVGWYEAAGQSSIYFTLTEMWNGTNWSVVPSPSPPHLGGGARLHAVSCLSAASCMAVGESLVFHDPGGYFTYSALIEAWNGTKWTRVAGPRLGHSSAMLNGVSCGSPSSCLAVGSDGPKRKPTYFTLAEAWDGVGWKFLPTPTPLTPGGTALETDSCTSSSSCMAVGYYGYNFGTGTSLTLAEEWNGVSWMRVHTPTPSDSGLLAGLSCTISSKCMAVGEHAQNSGQLVRATLTESWDGRRWTTVKSPNPSWAGASGLEGVSCSDAVSCMATGSFLDQTGEYQITLAEVWDGAGWARVHTPSPGSASDDLPGVSCTSSSRCMAVGYTDDLTLSEAWDGTSWKLVKTPHP